MKNTQARIRELESKIRALKGTYAIAGSLIDFIVESSQSRTVSSATGSAADLQIIIKFIPDKKLEQNKLIKMYGVMSGFITIEGRTHNIPVGSQDYRLDSEGNPYVIGSLSSAGSPSTSFTISMFAVISGPATGHFEYETSR